MSYTHSIFNNANVHCRLNRQYLFSQRYTSKVIFSLIFYRKSPKVILPLKESIQISSSQQNRNKRIYVTFNSIMKREHFILCFKHVFQYDTIINIHVIITVTIIIAISVCPLDVEMSLQLHVVETLRKSYKVELSMLMVTILVPF